MEQNWLEELELYNSSADSTEFEIELVARAIEKSKRVTVLTGAGISVESGIPDFRSSNGLWKKYDPSVYGTYKNFKKDPQKFWKMTETIHSIKANPNNVHKTLADLEKRELIHHIITQNVDGLHQEAGSKKVLEIHGTGKNCFCINCGYIANSQEEIWDVTPQPSEQIPKCKKCGGLMKLDVILFGEKLNREIYDEVIDATTNVDFLLVIGTSLQVAPCNVIPFRAKHNGAQVAFVNCTKTMMDEYADYVIRGDLNDVVPKIANKVIEIRERKNNAFRRAVLFSYSIAMYMVTVVVAFWSKLLKMNKKKPNFELFYYDEKRSETPVVSDFEDHLLRRHSVPLDDREE